MRSSTSPPLSPLSVPIREPDPEWSDRVFAAVVGLPFFLAQPATAFRVSLSGFNRSFGFGGSGFMYGLSSGSPDPPPRRCQSPRSPAGCVGDLTEIRFFVDDLSIALRLTFRGLGGSWGPRMPLARASQARTLGNAWTWWDTGGSEAHWGPSEIRQDQQRVEPLVGDPVDLGEPDLAEVVPLELGEVDVGEDHPDRQRIRSEPLKLPPGPIAPDRPFEDGQALRRPVELGEGRKGRILGREPLRERRDRTGGQEILGGGAAEAPAVDPVAEDPVGRQVEGLALEEQQGVAGVDLAREELADDPLVPLEEARGVRAA